MTKNIMYLFMFYDYLDILFYKVPAQAFHPYVFCVDFFFTFFFKVIFT